MQQWGLKLGTSTQIDDMQYSYFAYTNKLKAVTEQGTGITVHKLGDFTDKNTGTEDYGYDMNGNMINDLNKKIGTSTGIDLTTGGAITYNHLNLPQSITVKTDDGSTTKGTIAYTYDAGGNKLKKVTTEGSKVTTTLYLFGTYINDTLQFLPHEEGRIRFEKANPNTCATSQDRFIYDYFIKDHLGNVRMVLTEQKENICYPAATVEDSRYQVEDDIYDINNSRRIDKSSTGATQTSFENKLYRVHGGNTGEKTGLGAVLKVMAGDEVKITAESYYTVPGGGVGSPYTLAVSELLNALIGSSAINGTKGLLSTTDVNGIGTNSTNLSNFISNSAPASNTAKAYLNWILFDEQLKYISAGADPVETGGGYKLHTTFINSPVVATKNGYLYVYVSNESNLPVYFDNLAITHIPSPILEETHYYPFGLVMHGVSSKGCWQYSK